MRAQSMRSTQVLESACRPAPRGPIHKNETQKEDPSRMLSSIKMGDVGVVHPKLPQQQAAQALVSRHFLSAAMAGPVLPRLHRSSSGPAAASPRS